MAPAASVVTLNGETLGKRFGPRRGVRRPVTVMRAEHDAPTDTASCQPLGQPMEFRPSCAFVFSLVMPFGGAVRCEVWEWGRAARADG